MVDGQCVIPARTWIRSRIGSDRAAWTGAEPETRGGEQRTGRSPQSTDSTLCALRCVDFPACALAGSPSPNLDPDLTKLCGEGRRMTPENGGVEGDGDGDGDGVPDSWRVKGLVGFGLPDSRCRRTLADSQDSTSTDGRVSSMRRMLWWEYLAPLGLRSRRVACRD
jgi:hypothetical protein